MKKIPTINAKELSVLWLISQGYNVKDICNKLEERSPAISKIRKKLKEAGLIEFETYSKVAKLTKNGEYYAELYKRLK